MDDSIKRGPGRPKKVPESGHEYKDPKQGITVTIPKNLSPEEISRGLREVSEDISNDPPIKKGKPSWKPAEKLSLRNKKDGFRYRWVDKDPQNIQKKLAEGWQFVDPNVGVQAEHQRPVTVPDGNPLTSSTEYRELIAMALPEDIAQARDEYFQELTDRQTAGLKRQLQGDLDTSAQQHGASKASAHGSIVIE